MVLNLEKVYLCCPPFLGGLKNRNWTAPSESAQRVHFLVMAEFGQTDFPEFVVCGVLCVLCCVVLLCCCVVCVCVVCVCCVAWVLVSQFNGVGFHVWVLVSKFGLDRPSLDRPSPTAQNFVLFFPSPAAKFVLFFPAYIKKTKQF